MIELKDSSVFFREPTDSVIISIMEGKKGVKFTDDDCSQAFAFDGIYGYIDGNLKKEFLVEILDYAINNKTLSHITMIPQNDISKNVLDGYFSDNKTYECTIKARYQMEQKLHEFDRELINGLVVNLPDKFTYKKIDRDIFDKIQNHIDLSYLSESYASYDEYKGRGVGYVLLYEDMIVGGAISYSVFSKGIEMQFMVVPEYRGRGLAKSIASRLLLDCVDKELEVIWDAAHLTSVEIAKKLGYRLKQKYNSYEITYAKQNTKEIYNEN